MVYHRWSSTVTSLRWILRSRGNVDATIRGWPRAELPEASSYSWYLQSRYQKRMAARRALEWIGTLKARLFFWYEISDLFQTILGSKVIPLLQSSSLVHQIKTHKYSSLPDSECFTATSVVRSLMLPAHLASPRAAFPKRKHSIDDKQLHLKISKA